MNIIREGSQCIIVCKTAGICSFSNVKNSLKKQLNRMGPNIDSCGKPEITFRKSGLMLLIFARIVSDIVGKECIKQRRLSLTPYFASFASKRLWGTQSIPLRRHNLCLNFLHHMLRLIIFTIAWNEMRDSPMPS